MKVQNARKIRQMIASHPIEHRRIFSIVAHIDHGKSTAADFLLKRAGLISRQRSQDLGPAISMTEEEKERNITMYTSVVTLAFEYKNRDYLFQFNDTPGHISFTGEVSRALRSSDGVVVVVDALEGVMPQTITNMELAIRDERCKPVLFINKVDRLISELQLTSEEIGTRLAKIVDEVNELIRKYTQNHDLIDDDWQVDYKRSSVAIGSAKDGWAFTAQLLDENKLTVDQIFGKYQSDERKWLQDHLPLDEGLLRMIIEHCPDPRAAQTTKIPQIWNGDLTSATGQALLRCDPAGPVMGIVTKVIIGDHSNQITLVGRLFSGSLKASDNLFFHNREESHRIRRLGIMEITDILNVDVIPAGSLFAMTGPIGQAGETISEEGMLMKPFESITYVSEPVISRAIAPVEVGNRIKLHDLVRKWLMVDPTLSVTPDENDNRMVLHGVDPLQLEVLISKIGERIRLHVSEPAVIHRESILVSSKVITTKSNNGHNRITVQLQPLPEEVIDVLRSGQISRFMTGREIGKVIASVTDEFDEKFFRGYWAHQGTNLLIEATKGVQRLDRIREFIIQSWSDFTEQGTLSGEPLHGVMMVISDAQVHMDPAHSGVTEIISMINAACNLSFLSAKPVLLEPMMTVEIKAPHGYTGKLDTMLRNRRGKINDLMMHDETSVIRAQIPATQINGLADLIRDITSGTALFGYEFDQFQVVPDYIEDDLIVSLRKRNNLPKNVPDGSSWNKLIYKQS